MRTRKSKLPKGEEVEINKIRGMIREEIIKRYGSVASFLNTSKGEEFGGKKIRPHLYDSGTINFNVISTLCEYLGFGKLTRNIVVTRSYHYNLIETSDEVK